MARYHSILNMDENTLPQANPSQPSAVAAFIATLGEIIHPHSLFRLNSASEHDLKVAADRDIMAGYRVVYGDRLWSGNADTSSWAYDPLVWVLCVVPNPQPAQG